jgi:hypothetical protein
MKYCYNGGAQPPKKAPEAADGDTWDCPNCGEKGIPSRMKFCFSCGAPKP